MKSDGKSLADEVASLREENARLRGQIEVFMMLRGQTESPALPTSPPPTAGVIASVVRMSLKQRAVLFAVLGGGRYDDIADVMGVDQTTVKIHMKAALIKLSLSSKLELMARKDALIKEIESANPEAIFGLPLDWMVTQPVELMEQLSPVRRNLPPPGGAKK